MRTKPYSEFECGILWAVARVVELYGEPTIAAEVLKSGGIDLNLKKVDVADRRYLKPLLDEPALRKRV